MNKVFVVDTCVLVDIALPDPTFGAQSAKYLEGLRAAGCGLSVSPVTMVELAPTFGGDIGSQKEFLDLVGVAYDEPWTAAETEAAHPAWAAYVARRQAMRKKHPKSKQAAEPRRPVADVLIGAFASRRYGIVTRDPEHFARCFPDLELRNPAAQ